MAKANPKSCPDERGDEIDSTSMIWENSMNIFGIYHALLFLDENY